MYFGRYNGGRLVAVYEGTHKRDGFTEIGISEYKSFNDHVNIGNIEKMRIKAWLSANDYKINKHILGEYSDDDPRWTSYLEERKRMLTRYNELESQ